ncbi:MAG: hypothetical protein PHT60_13655 [Acidiphilium sp.]|nr:hypothetical protein [Acidiphilium sp.]MDD4936809.1 hypothetical protein [Acidiphilium sp.]
MPALLLPYLTRFLPWIVAGLLVMGGIVYVRHLQDQLTIAHQNVAAAQTTIDRLTATNQQNLVALKRLQAADAAWQAALTSTIASDSGVARFADGMLATVAATPATSDAPVAQVLASTLAAIAKVQGNTP